MSDNQSRGESSRYRRGGRSGNSSSQRHYSAAAASSSSNRRKVNNHGQGVQPRVNIPNTNTNPNPNADSVKSVTSGVPNGARLQQSPAQDVSVAPVAGVTMKPSDVSTPKSSPGLPRARQGGAGVLDSDATGPSTPIKEPVDASKTFSLQFGSISPGLMNGMQIPARTSSAPPNFDDQKQAQARLDSLKTVKASTTALPKQQLQSKKDAGSVDQSNASEVHSIPKPKKDVQTIPASPVFPSQKLSGPPFPMQSQMPFHHPQLHVQYGSPNPRMQSQGMSNIPLPMPLPMGSPLQVQQPVFVTGIQHHQMQRPLHQAQNLNFLPQMGQSQMLPQLGNMGIGLGQNFPQQQKPGELGRAHHTPVKITHPETREELRLDSFSKELPSRPIHPHPQALAQSQVVPSFRPGHPMNYYSNSNSASPHFFQPPASTPLTSAQSALGSQGPMLYNQVTVKPASNAPERVNESSFLGGTPAVDNNELHKTPRTHEDTFSTLSSMASKPSNATFGSLRSENLTIATPSATVEDSVADVAKETKVSKSGSFKEKVQSTPPNQVELQSEVLIISTPSMEMKEEVFETSKKGGSSEEDLKCIETIVTETSSTRVQESNAELVGSEDREKNVMSNETEQHVVTTSTINETMSDDKLMTPADIISAETSSRNLGPSQAGDDLSSFDVSVTIPEGDDMGNSVSLASPTSSVNTSKATGNVGKSKKKRKDILKFADAQGTTADLYNAYKGPEEKKGTMSSETLEISSGITTKQVEKDDAQGHNKIEPDDWEDAAEISTPKHETSVKENDGMVKKYSRDFLLKFSGQCTDLPPGFKLTPDIAEAVYNNASRESYPSPGRGVNRSAARLESRPSNVGYDDRWSKQPGSMGAPGRDTRLDIGYAGNVAGFRPVHGGVLRNFDSDRWQPVSGYHKGLIPSPRTPMPVMHKAERKYEVGKVTDEEQAKQRQLKSILNKLTPQNFEKLFEQVKQVNIDNAETLSGVISQIFDKALMEPTFCEMYANFCSRLAVELPDFSQHNQKITFKRLLLNKCQEEFERGEREEEEANRTEEEGEVKQTEEQREEKRIKARRRMLGNIRLIGELYKKKMLTERIMHECIMKLLGQLEKPDEEDLESLCKLMSTIGVIFDHPKAKEHLDVYFDTMFKLSNNMLLSSRVRFMLKDVIDLRKNRWQQRMKVEGPKKIDEVHRDAAQERHAQTTRLSRGQSFNSSSLRRGQGQGQGQGQPIEFGPRGSNSNLLPSPNSQMGGFRAPPQQLRSYGNQDSRFDERQSFENRSLSMPLRPIGYNDSVTLGPQGGLAWGMSSRGQPSPVQSIPLSDMPSTADSRRVGRGPNGYGPRENLGSRHIPTYGHSHVNQDSPDLEHSSMPSSPSAHHASADKNLSEERLRDMSMSAIKEFYSVRDEKEVALCIKDLNSPSFYPTMISIWVSDSFERKDADRNVLAKLLVNLSKSRHGMLSQDTYIQGFEAVLATLEESVNDAPKAAEYLGQIFGKMLLEDVISYKDVCQLIYDGGEEQGRLVKIGLAAEVVGVIFEILQSEKGEPFLKDIRAGSNLGVKDFRPPNSKKPLRLDKFI